MIKKLSTRLAGWRYNLILSLNAWLLKRSKAAAEEKAKRIVAQTGKTVYVYLYRKDYEAVPKQHFKEVWKTKPGMKQRTLQEWQKYVHEFKANSRQIHTCS